MLLMSSWGARVSEGFWNEESSTSKFSLIVFLSSPVDIMDKFKLRFPWSQVLITCTKINKFTCCCRGNAWRSRDYKLYSHIVSTQPFALAYHIIHTINNQCLYSINTGGILLTILHLLFLESWITCTSRKPIPQWK